MHKSHATFSAAIITSPQLIVAHTEIFCIDRDGGDQSVVSLQTRNVAMLRCRANDRLCDSLGYLYLLAGTRQVRAHGVGIGNRARPSPTLLRAYSVTQLPRRNRPTRVECPRGVLCESSASQLKSYPLGSVVASIVPPHCVRTDGSGSSTVIV